MKCIKDIDKQKSESQAASQIRPANSAAEGVEGDPQKIEVPRPNDEELLICPAARSGSEDCVAKITDNGVRLWPTTERDHSEISEHAQPDDLPLLHQDMVTTGDHFAAAGTGSHGCKGAREHAGEGRVFSIG